MSDTKDTGARLTTGWGWPGLSRKPHYFEGGRSLCGKWGYAGALTPDIGPGPDDCAACARKMVVRRAARPTPTDGAAK